MSRSGYSEDCDGWAHIRWRGAVAQAMRGKRGQAFLREMLEALNFLEEKRLISDYLVRGGEVCAIGAVGVRRGIDMTEMDPEDRVTVAKSFRIAPALVAEIVYMNDECGWSDTPDRRFDRMRCWIKEQIREDAE